MLLSTLLLALLAAPTQNESAFAKLLTWSHSVSRDEMRNTSSEIALLASQTTISLSTPYSGGSQGLLKVVRYSQYASTVAEYTVELVIAPGQITCDAIMYGDDSCIISFKIDDQPIRRLAGRIDLTSSEYATFRASLSRNEKAFGNIGAAEFIPLLRTAHKLTMEASSFQAGSYQFKFDAGGFPITGK